MTIFDGPMSRHPVGPSWEICHKIAQGSFGKVYMGVHAITKDPVAVKMEPRPLPSRGLGGGGA